MPSTIYTAYKETSLIISSMIHNWNNFMFKQQSRKKVFFACFNMSNRSLSVITFMKLLTASVKQIVKRKNPLILIILNIDVFGVSLSKLTFCNIPTGFYAMFSKYFHIYIFSLMKLCFAVLCAHVVT